MRSVKAVVIMSVDEQSMTTEVSFGLWRTWSHALALNAADLATRRLMIKVLVSEYWGLVARGYNKTTHGRKALLELFDNINAMICFRLMTEPRIQMSLFTPHLVGPKRQVWPTPGPLGIAP